MPNNKKNKKSVNDTKVKNNKKENNNTKVENVKKEIKVKKEAKESRCLFLTLEGGNRDDVKIPIVRGEEDFNYVKDYFVARFTCIEYIVGVFEKHLSDEDHLHVVVYLRSARFSQENIKLIRTYFDEWKNCKTNNIKMGDQHINKLMGYVCKTARIDDNFTPYIYGNITKEKCVKVGRQYKYSEEMDNAILNKELECEMEYHESNIVTASIACYMEENGFYINSLTGELYHREIAKDRAEVCDYVRICDILGKLTHPFRIIYGAYGIDMLKKVILNKEYHPALPQWNPKLTKFQFDDGCYDIAENKFYYGEKDNDCVNYFKCSLEDIREQPTYYIERLYDVFCFHTEVEEFRKELYKCFLPKRLRDKCLMVCGETLKGKSLIISPFINIFNPVLGDWADDDTFTVASIAQYPKVIANEVNPMNYKKYGEKIMKEMLEGLKCKARIKHKQEKATVILKNIIFIANAWVKEIEEYEDLNDQAIRKRLTIFNTFGEGVSDDDDHSIINTDKMLGQIIYWLGNNNPDYSQFKERELPALKDPSRYDHYEFDPVNHPGKLINIPIPRVRKFDDY